MAGGPNAAIMMCQHCGGKANRTAEGMETDQYQCEECGRGFGVDWRHGPPTEPCWPQTADALDEARRLFALLAEQRRSTTERS